MEPSLLIAGSVSALMFGCFWLRLDSYEPEDWPSEGWIGRISTMRPTFAEWARLITKAAFWISMVVVVVGLSIWTV